MFNNRGIFKLWFILYNKYNATKSICFQKPHMSIQQFPAVYLEFCVSHLFNILFHPFSCLLGYYTQPC